MTDETFLSSHITNKYVSHSATNQPRHRLASRCRPVLWRLSARPSLKESYRLHSYLTVKDHTMSLAHHYHSRASVDSCIHVDESLDDDARSSFALHTGGKYPPLSSSSIELDHPYSCSSRRVSQALRTLAEPQPPSPSSPPPLSASNSMSTSQQMMLIPTPLTPPPSSMINNGDIDISQADAPDQQQFHAKSSTLSSFILSPATQFFAAHPQPYVMSPTSTAAPPPATSSSSSSTMQPSSPMSSKQTPSSCGLVQLVQLHRIHPPTNTHKFASSTPVTTSDS